MFRHLSKRLAHYAAGTVRYSTKQDAVVEAYKQKLLKKAREMGVSNIDELQSKLKDEIAAKKTEFNKIDPLAELDEYERKMAEEVKRKAQLNAEQRGAIDASKPQAYKTLDSFLALDKLQDLSKQEIEFLWRARFQARENAISAVVPVDIFNRMYKVARENPMFVLPLPRNVEAAPEDQAVELHYVQWNFVGPCTTHVIVTSLAEYKLHGEFAKPHSSFMFHSELAQDKKIVLFNGQVETDSNVTIGESQMLLLNIQRFYGALNDSEANQRRYALLRAFNTGSADFSVEKLIEEAQSLEN